MTKLPLGFVKRLPVLGQSLHCALFSPSTAFGDMWRICSQLCRASSFGWSCSIDPVSIDTKSCPVDWPCNRQPGVDHSIFIRDILDHLVGGDAVEIRRDLSHNVHVEVNVFAPAWPCRDRWIAGEGWIPYQFDGFGDAVLKCPVADHVTAWLSRVRESDLQPFDCGSMRPLSESAIVMQRCQRYVGCDSGLVQMAYSIGCPVDLVIYAQRRRALRNWHGPQPSRVLRTLDAWHPDCVTAPLALIV